MKRTKGKDSESVLEMVVPNISRMNLLAEAHDRSHRGIDHTYSTLKEAGYWWPKMRVDVNEYCRKCIICRAAKAGTTGKVCWSDGVSSHGDSRPYTSTSRDL